MEDIVGLLRDEGYEDAEIEALLPPSEIYRGDLSQAPERRASLASWTPLEVHDSPEGEAAVRAILQAARDEARPPGPQAIAVPGAAVKAKGARAVRIDTEASYRKFRRSMSRPPADTPEALEAQAQRELLGEAAPSEAPASPLCEQVCLLCGRESAGSAACAACRCAVLGFGAEDSFGGHGVATEDFTGFAAHRGEPDAYVPLVGEFGEFGVASEESLLNVLGDLDALETPLPSYDQLRDIPLDLEGHTDQPDISRHVTAWRSGPHLYSSIRVTGWDGEPRVLTMAGSFGGALATVVGLAERAGVAPAATLAFAEPLAERYGASRLIPRLAVASPKVLRAVDGRCVPTIVGIVPLIPFI